jgi:hypothetical protein
MNDLSNLHSHGVRELSVGLALWSFSCGVKYQHLFETQPWAATSTIDVQRFHIVERSMTGFGAEHITDDGSRGCGFDMKRRCPEDRNEHQGLSEVFWIAEPLSWGQALSRAGTVQPWMNWY